MVRAKGRPIDQPIVHKVHRPAFVRPCGGWQGAPRDRGTLAPPALDREPGFAVEPVDPLPVHRIALSAQQHPQASIAPTAAALRRAPSAAPATQMAASGALDTADSSAPHPKSDTPAARSGRRRRATPRRPPAAPRPSRAFSQFVLQELEVQRLVGHHALEPLFLLLERPPPLQLLALESAIQPLPAVKRVLTDPMLPDEVRPRCPRLRFLQYGEDLLLGVLGPRHRSLTGLMITRGPVFR